VFEKSVSSQLDAFKAGFNHVCNNPFVKTFQPSELELLVCGSSELDFDDLEEGAVYTDGYEESSRAIKWFWSIVKKLTVPEKKQFLAFMSGTDRIPVGGLGDLRFTISRQGPDSEKYCSLL
jgi:ubiquitin-protein ligase E3 A